MANDLGEAARTILGMVLAGIILLSLAQDLDNPGPVNFEAWGTLMLVVAVGAGVLLVLVLLKGLLS